MLSKMVIIEPWFMSCKGTAVISVVDLQNHMDLLNSELGFPDETHVTVTPAGNKVTSIEALGSRICQK